MKINQENAGRTWFISDPHFGHKSIIGHARPRFIDLDSMHLEMIQKWNSRVSVNDTVFVLGDFAWTPQAALEIRPRLHGHIRLVLGNHDSIGSFHELGIFQRLHYWYEFPWCGLTAHHIPLHPKMMRCGKAQIHGHIHNTDYKLGPRYMNVSAEVLNYYPVNAVKVYEWASSVNKGMAGV